MFVFKFLTISKGDSALLVGYIVKVTQLKSLRSAKNPKLNQSLCSAARFIPVYSFSSKKNNIYSLYI